MPWQSVVSVVSGTGSVDLVVVCPDALERAS